MGKIIRFPEKQPAKFGFERVKKRRKENPDQLGLFVRKTAQVLRLTVGMGAFEEALLLDEQNDKSAEESYRRAIAEGDHSADAYCNLGIIESNAGRVTKAFDCFTKSLELNARHFEAHYNLGNLYLESENLRLAKMHYRLAAEIEPGFRNLHYNLGLVLALMGDKEAAIDALVKYKKMASRNECGKADSLIRELKKSLPAGGRKTER